jgi:NitT/TauT family transport system ATP-binding protein
MQPKLEVKGVIKTFPQDGKEVTALNDINLTVYYKEFLTVIGPSGCGKSTLLRCIAGLESPDSGRVTLNGREVKTPGPERMMVFQGFDQLFPWLNVLGNITYPLRIANRRMTAGERKLAAEYYLNLVGLPDAAGLYPYQLSGGMKQRVAIARALSLNPEVLLMDEPFGSLDAITRGTLQKELIRIWRETGVTIIFVTHNLEEAIALADRVAVFSQGRIRAIVNNHLPRPRSLDNPEFGMLWDRLHYLLDAGTGSKDARVVASGAATAGLVY